jgi:hypothetical protein
LPSTEGFLLFFAERKILQTPPMSNQETLSHEILALIDAFDAELDAHRSPSREDRELAKMARREALAEARATYGV